MGVLEKMLVGRERDRSTYAPFWPEEEHLVTVEPVKRSTSTIASTKWDLTFFPLASYGQLAREISTLAASAVEGNLFIEPEFALAGLQRIEHGGVMLLCLWEQLPKNRKLRFFMPVTQPKTGLPRYRVLSNFTHHFAPYGTPLLHRDNAGETIETLLRLIGDPSLDLPMVVKFDWQAMDGEVVRLLRQSADSLGLEHETALVHQRAVLAPSTGDFSKNQPYLRTVMGKKRLREAQRQMRRLREKGEVSFKMAAEPDAVLDAVEGFLTLEARGWKGRGGTALYSIKQIAAFSRQAVSSLVAMRRCKIHTMKFDDKIIAALICFETSGEYFTWKIAFDEDYRHYSPGVQLLMRATDHMLGLKSFKRANSLAAANHKMINHLWQERQTFGTLLIGAGKIEKGRVARIAGSIERLQRLREGVKSLISQFLKFR